MLRIALTQICESPSLNLGVNSIFVRWRRKPRWLPVAKSKLFRVPERKQQDPDEQAELMRIHNNYKLQVRSVRSFLIAEIEQNRKKNSKADNLSLEMEQEAELQKCYDLNEAWNAKISENRNKRLEKEMAAKRKQIQKRLDAAKIREDKRYEHIAQIVKAEKEKAKFLITKENLDGAIEFALANPTDYNFCIDLQGNIFKGRETVPENIKTEQKIASVNA